MTTRFLIVDDDPDLRYLVNVALSRWGHQAIAAPTMAEARRACAEDRPDVLLLDVSMPEMDGPTFLASLRAEALAPRHVYLLSALDPQELAELADALGVRYLVKPFTLQGLRDGLADVLGPSAP
ncbi:MAG: response regulator [Actinobacteria bacterium]|nr:response regulator [Actinomycetota bacterium]